LYERKGAGGGFQRAVVYNDTGERRGRTEVSVDTIAGVVRVFSGGAAPVEVRLAVDPLDDPQPDALVETADVAGCPRAQRAGKVTTAKGSAGVAQGAECVVLEMPHEGACQVRVACGAKILYPDGKARVEGDEVIDDKTTAEDRDPKLHIAGDHVDVADEGLRSWAVGIVLTGGP
jgi:hypothetical protein